MKENVDIWLREQRDMLMDHNEDKSLHSNTAPVDSHHMKCICANAHQSCLDGCLD